MDDKTLKAYSDKANEYSDDWSSQPEPSDMYELLTKYFVKNGNTADIGCGNGRDAKWLADQGFTVKGYDFSSELLEIAKKANPQIEFHKAILPALAEIKEKFDNILCETVLMHLPQTEIPQAIENLLRILKPQGILYLSWRVTDGQDIRHTDGRLYSAFQPDRILQFFNSKNLLHFEDKTSISSGKRVCRLIVKQD